MSEVGRSTPEVLERSARGGQLRSCHPDRAVPGPPSLLRCVAHLAPDGASPRWGSAEGLFQSAALLASRLTMRTGLGWLAPLRSLARSCPQPPSTSCPA